MKALLRSTLLGLVVFAGYAAFSSPNTNLVGPAGPRPCPVPEPSNPGR